MLSTLEGPELIFGICAPIGTENSKAVELLKEILVRFDYSPHHYKVSDLMATIELSDRKLSNEGTEARYTSYISYANRLREISDNPSILGMICCAAVRSFRRKKGIKPDKYLPYHAYIFDQFKRKEELSLLKQIYGKSFVVVSLYSDRAKRIQRLSRKIANDQNAARANRDHESKAIGLIVKDENEDDNPYGQRLSEAFPLADVFLNSDNINDARKILTRFFEGFFGSNRTSPTRDEYGMYAAKSASLRSLDLSRQVGAAIFKPTGEIISQGCNEVPKPGGGTYWDGDPQDARDYTIGHDENERLKRALLKDLVMRILDSKYIKEGVTPEDVVDHAINDSQKSGTLIRDALLMDVLEFGRTVHAEMSAISDSARLDTSTIGATLYSTTFPCHMCARHIIAAGIKRVVFIEPYPKSYAEELHKEITVGTDTSNQSKVQFSPFIGIAPERYRDVFSRSRRKNSKGDFLEWREGKPKPIVLYTVATYLYNEVAIVYAYNKIIKKLRDENKITIKKKRKTVS